MAEGGAGLRDHERHGRQGSAGGEEAPEAERPVLCPLIHGELAGLQGVERRLGRQGERNPGPLGRAILAPIAARPKVVA